MWIDIKLSDIHQISYGLRRPQLNFIRLLSSETRQDIELTCSEPISYLDNIQLIGWNKKVFNARDSNRVEIVTNTCNQVKSGSRGILLLRMRTDMDLTDLPIVDVIISKEPIDRVEILMNCYL